MKKKILTQIATLSLFSSIGAYASSYEANVDIPVGGWYQGVTLPVNAGILDVKSGDSITIETSIATSGISATWGSLTLGNCEKIDQYKTTCKVTSVNSWSNDLSFGLNAPGTAFTNKSARIIISSSTQEKSKGTIEVQLPVKPDYLESEALATVKIYQGDTLVGEVNNTQWDKTARLQVEFSGQAANFKISVPALENAQGSATPASFSLSNNATQKVSIHYKAPQPVLQGNIEIKASTSGSQDSQPGYKLKNAQGEIVHQGMLNFNQTTLIKDLPTTKDGQLYTLEAESYVNDGFIYTPDPSYTINVQNGKTTNTPAKLSELVFIIAMWIYSYFALPRR